MMKVVLIALGLVACSLAFPLDHPHWVSFKQRFGKSYEHPMEESMRARIFRENLVLANKLSAVDPTAKYGITQFMDLTPKEFAQRFLTFQLPTVLPRKLAPLNLTEVPDSVNWLEQGLVTRVKNQGQCGSCWAFCSVGAMEGAWAKAGHKLIEFSEKQLVDCDASDNGCNGGWPTNAFDYVIKNGGIMAEEDYPYEAVQDTCHFKADKIAATFKDDFMAEGNEKDMKEALFQHGPLAIAVDATKFQYYAGHIMDGKGCVQGRPNHGVLAVGYGSENGVDYWLIKNSWSSQWGEDGYIRLRRGTNACGVEEYPMGIVA